jgi:hydroxymethylglutaryl-CoA lyase
MNKSKVKIIECPRDAMQGLHDFIPTQTKADYINALLKVGFDTLDMGSFVSPKAIPQLRDTAEVLAKLDLRDTKSKLLVITANKRGAEAAVQFDEIDYLGFPFSISSTFQQRNINSTIEQSLDRLKEVQELCVKHNKKMVTYFSMAFGNPYNDAWSAEIVSDWTEKLVKEVGVEILSMSDTIGSSTPATIEWIFDKVIKDFPDVEIGAHLHTTPDKWEEKIASSYANNCLRFDSAIKGYGGCPMATDDLTGNMPTEHLIKYFNDNNIEHGLDEEEFAECMLMSNNVFPQ